MADFERKLSMLAERGAPVGPEEMIERVEAALAEDPLVVVNKQRKGFGMTIETNGDGKSTGRPRTPGWAWAAAAFVVVVALGALFVVLDEGEGGGDAAIPAVTSTIADSQTTAEELAPTSTEGVTSTTSTEERFAARMEVVEAMVEARNSGDYQAWRSFFPEVRPDIFGGTVEDESELEWQRAMVAAGDVWTITGDCREILLTSIECPMTLVNGFWGPAGLFFRVPGMLLRFGADDQLTSIGTDYWELAGDTAEYADAFDTWLAETYPDVHASFGPRVEGEGAMPNPEDMPTAVQYVDEFIAQTDVYPLDG